MGMGIGVFDDGIGISQLGHLRIILSIQIYHASLRPQHDGPHGDPPNPFVSDSSFDEPSHDGNTLDDYLAFSRRIIKET
ncbi:hypothetical protein FRX31_009015 [Thalictrum thalictroides]|uniref:Uncharacterized protein n=1 Tax=Thalictrum thalictroides TaxID=46969 RepID=A0A7J6WWX6_THATH|nr:hypothetical protein FRX31_009015 [Thalictrum thalictroides]